MSEIPIHKTYKYLFGPVPSRRLGRSLGIDVTPFKTCSFDCVYCQCGCTTRKTAERGEFVPLKDVCTELEQWLAEDGTADVLTFAGSGEPTLYSRLGELIAFIKTKTDIPVIVLSNGTLLHRADVRTDLQQADVVKSTFSAWDEASFQQIHRPADGVTFEQMHAGTCDLRKAFSGELWLEVFLIDGMNSAPKQVEKIAAAIRNIGADKIHLNTAIRPPAETGVRPLSKEQMETFCSLFTPTAEVTASFKSSHAGNKQISTEALIELIHRHPATAAQLAAVSGTDEQQICAALAPLVANGHLTAETREDETWYR